MSKRPLGITFFPEDWTRPIQSLPPIEFGVLARLALQSIDSTEPGTLPNNDRALAFRAGVTVDEWATIRPSLSEFMEVAGEAVRFPTIKRRYDSAAAFKRQQAEHARNRWGKGGTCEPHATHERPSCDPPCGPHASAFCVPVHVPEKPKPQEQTAAQSGGTAAKPAAPPRGNTDGLWGNGRWGIRLDPQARQWHGIEPYDRARWRDLCPAVDIDRQLAKAADWCLSDVRGRKSNYRKFLNGWLQRAQDDAGRMQPASNGFRKPAEETQAEKAARILADLERRGVA